MVFGCLTDQGLGICPRKACAHAHRNGSHVTDGSSDTARPLLRLPCQHQLKSSLNTTMVDPALVSIARNNIGRITRALVKNLHHDTLFHLLSIGLTMSTKLLKRIQVSIFSLELRKRKKNKATDMRNKRKRKTTFHSMMQHIQCAIALVQSNLSFVAKYPVIPELEVLNLGIPEL